MNKQLEQAINGIFEILSTDQKRRALDFMQEICLAQDGKSPIIEKTDDTNFVRIEPTREEMVAAFGACGNISKVAAAYFILDDMAATFQTTIELCKHATSYLDSLPVSTLRNIALYEHEKATAYLLSSFPVKANILMSLDCLLSFCEEAHDPTGNDIRDLKSSLLDLWDWEATQGLKPPEVCYGVSSATGESAGRPV